MTLLLLLCRLVLMPPSQAAQVAGAALDVDSETLTAICARESRCSYQGLHEIDSWVGPVAYRRAVDRGWLPRWCPISGGRRWGTRGAWGLIAAYHLPCVPPEVLDLPIVSALVAGAKLRRIERGRGLPAGERWANG